MCMSPSFGATYCAPCTDARTGGDPVDLVAVLVYGIGGQQSGRVLRGYKDAANPQVRTDHTTVMRCTLHVGLGLHQHCIEEKAGQKAMVLIVPSGHASRHHQDLALSDDWLGMMSGVNAAPSDHVTVAADKFAMRPGVDVAGRHVLLIDDTWSTGTSARSAALTVREAGAVKVSVLAVGRWASPEYTGDWPDGVTPQYRNTGEFLAKLPKYDPHVCPVGQCVNPV